MRMKGRKEKAEGRGKRKWDPRSAGKLGGETGVSQKRKISSSHVEEEREISDRISDLPDPLLHSIISRLPTREALATSILSRRWRPFCKHLTHLDLLPWRMVKGKLIHSSISSACGEIERLLFSQDSESNISSCRIGLVPENPPMEVLQEWIEHLKVNKMIEELSLIGFAEEFEYVIRSPDISFIPPDPVSFFRCRTLRVLELQSLIISDASLFEGCANLCTLKLDSVSLSDETLGKIIFNCKLLENLVLKRCVELVNLEIHDGDTKRLKYLEVGFMRPHKFELRAESLSFLSLNNFSWPSEGIYIECPNLNEFRVYSTLISMTSRILRRFSGLVGEEGKIGKELNVEALHANFDLTNVEDNLVLRYILRVWSKLQRLHIINQVGRERSDNNLPRLSYPEDRIWDGQLEDSIITYDLKFVQIKGFSGREKETRLAIHLIKNAPRLEKLVIQFANGFPELKEDAKQRLLALRASNNASIVLI